MPAKNLLRVDQKGVFSHIYNRGIENRIIFNDDLDYQMFLEYLKEYLNAPSELEAKKKSFTVNGKTFKGMPHLPKNYFNKVELLSYSLMPTHFHLVLHQLEQGAVESFLRSLATRYSMYFNKKYKRQGALFEGPYKSVQIVDTKALLHFSAYLNQIHNGARYSSHKDYVAPNQNSIVKTDLLLNLFKNAENNTFEGERTYKDFAEKYIFSDDERNDIHKLMLENHAEPVATTQHISSPSLVEKKELKSAPEHKNEKSRFPEYIGLCLLFVILCGFGVRNISVSSLEAKDQTTVITKQSGLSSLVSDDSSLEVKAFSEVSNTPVVLSASDSATPMPTSTPSPLLDNLIYTTILVKEGSGTINVYAAPFETSEIHMTAKDGDHFEGTPYDSKWYEVKLNGETRGFMLSDYVEIEQSNKQ